MNRALVESIKERVSIADIISRYVKLTQSGTQMKGLCPFHGEKSPSFYVSPLRGNWKCFGCGKGGDVISFIQEIEHVSFREALQNLAESAGIQIDSRDIANSGDTDTVSPLYKILADSVQIYHKSLVQNQAALRYLEGRGVTRETIDRFMIGYAADSWQNLTHELQRKFSVEQCVSSGMCIQGKQGIYDRFRSRILFPTRDIRDRYITYSGRIWSETGEFKTERDTSGKYINGPETAIYKKSKILYGLSEARIAISQKKRALLVEGHLDCVMSHQLGYTETIALAGTALTPEHTELLHRFCDEIILCLDADNAGQKATSRSVLLLYEAGFYVKIASLSPGDDPADVIRSRPEEYRDAVENATDYVAARISQMQSNHLDLRQAEKIIKDEMYPIIACQMNPLYRDQDLSKIAVYLRTDSETVRAHMKAYSTTKQITSDSRQSTQQLLERNHPPAEKLVAVWKQLIDSNVPHLVPEYLLLATGQTYTDEIDFIERNTLPDQDYLLLYNAYYFDRPPSEAITECLSQYCIHYLTQKKKDLLSDTTITDTLKVDTLKSILVYEQYTKTNLYANKI